jgi:hypothetical protein
MALGVEQKVNLWIEGKLHGWFCVPEVDTVPTTYGSMCSNIIIFPNVQRQKHRKLQKSRLDTCTVATM